MCVHYHYRSELRGLTRLSQVWRPIKQIFKDPLAVADAHSVPDTDLVGTALIYPDRRGETYSVKPNPNHRWYFKYGQSPSEVTLIKCFDSLKDGRARRVPHTAFTNQDEEYVRSIFTRPLRNRVTGVSGRLLTLSAHYRDKPSRESIEVRALVFYD